jgi:hypothetical protein
MVSASGCGVMGEIMTGPSFPGHGDCYCALKSDVEIGKESFSEGSFKGLGLGLLCLVDAVPSAVFDTLLLPGVYLGALISDSWEKNDQIRRDSIQQADSDLNSKHD